MDTYLEFPARVKKVPDSGQLWWAIIQLRQKGDWKRLLFMKKRMPLGSFIRMFANEVLKVPEYSYEDYRTTDSKLVLSQKEFILFNNNMLILRLLLLYAIFMDSKNKGEIEFSLDDFNETFIQAVSLSYQDNAVEQAEAERLSEVFSQQLGSFTKYIKSIPAKSLSEKGFAPHACLHFTYKYTKPSVDKAKNGTYIALINNQRTLLIEYYEKALKKVKIIE